MRWLYIDPSNRDEVAYRKNKLAAIETWWRALADKSAEIGDLMSGHYDWDLPAWMDKQLAPVDTRLMWEFGPAVEVDGLRLVITPETNRWLRPLLEDAVLPRAPQLAGWEFYGWRLPEAFEQLGAHVAARTSETVEGVTFEARRGRGAAIDLTFHFPHVRKANEESVLCAAFVAAETLLGEEILDRWIGLIDVAGASKSKWLGISKSAKGLQRPLAELRGVVETMIDDWRARLPAKPAHAYIQDAEWNVYQLEPNPNETGLREDQFVATSARPDVFEATCQGAVFSSGCYSRCGETFCVVKIAGHGRTPQDRLAERSRLEDKLNELLVAPQWGAVVGAGMGIRAAYVDLALTNVPLAIPLLREAADACQIPAESWLLFWDSDLAQEWTGLREATPAPVLPCPSD